MTLKGYFNTLVDELSELYPDIEAKAMVYRLMAHYLQRSKLDIALNAQEEVAQHKLLDAAMVRLLKHEPLQYVCGMADFYDLEFNVSPSVLIPRPETEELVKLILEQHQGHFSLLDIGTGSACIPIAIKRHAPQAQVSACDLSEEALRIARSNAIKHKVELSLFQCDILDRKAWDQNQYDIIVSNPPYVCEKEKVHMRPNVLNYEPAIALFVKDDDPLLFYRTIADYALSHLRAEGQVYFEINEAMGEATVELLRSKGFHDIKLIQDIFAKDRIISAKI